MSTIRIIGCSAAMRGNSTVAVGIRLPRIHMGISVEVYNVRLGGIAVRAAWLPAGSHQI